MEFNRDGFVIKGGGVKVFSEYSALSGKKLPGGAVTQPVPGHPGLFFRLAPDEAGNVTADQLQAICQKADALYPVAKKAAKATD